jgi:hypothetical protein
MSWIRDVKDELRQLDASAAKLRRFGIMMAVLITIIAAYLMFIKANHSAGLILALIALLLLTPAIIFPTALKPFFILWMALAFSLGWFVSRVLLVIIFFLVLTPTGWLGRLFRKRWLDIDFNEKKESYWIPKEKDKPVNYEKMY